ncbi:MAG TPA: hypothetical protein VN112_25090 [Ensifer sp.]|nr:hypothetical protein [Ensifer sp.]
MPIYFDVFRDGSAFSAAPDQGQKFPVGQRVRYKSRKSGVDHFGLSNDGGFFGNSYARQFLYKAADFKAQYAFMAEFIEPTAQCEGQSFISLNTYDRARFTFGFGQFAAHLPNEDFIRWFKDMLGLAEAKDYFPDLSVSGDKIVRHGSSGDTILADAASTAGLQAYLNPSLVEVEDSEVLAAARFIHWTVNHRNARELQVRHMVETALRRLRDVDRAANLDGRTADLCCIVFDIRHQGRGGNSDIKEALRQADAFEALLTIGKVSEPERVINLRKALTPKREAFKAFRWSSKDKKFI